MHGVNPGTELGRYTVNTRIETITGGERWAARDTTLERDVTLLVMPADDPTTDAALDAARRAAGIEATQLVRILDVGTHDSLAYVAEESLDDARTLASAIGRTGLPSEEVRRITGEVATGIEAARTRGLHHLALTPETVLIAPDGRVKVRGLATTAALAGIETEGEQADQDDATGVVALTYAGLTATWPLDTPSGLPSATRGEGGPPPPSRVAVGVPSDLDTICRETLAEGHGPESPGDYAAQVAPWSRIPLAGAMSADPTTRSAPSTEPSSTDSAPRSPAGAAGAGAISYRAGDATDPDDDADTNEIPVYRDPHPGSATPDESDLTSDAGATRPIPLAPRGPEADRADAEPTDSADSDAGDGGRDPRGGTSAGATAAAAAATAAGAVGTGAKVIGDRLGKASKTAAELSRERLAQARARREALREDRARHSSLGAAPVSAEVEPPAPLLPAEASETPTREQANLVLMIVAGFVAIACLIGAIGTAQIGDGSDLSEILTGDGTAPVQPTSTSSSEPDSTSSTEGSTKAPASEPFAILNAAGFDPPPGDGVEHNAEVQRIYDGDPSTVWTTEGYNAADFAGVKTGVGIAVDLGQNQQISTVTLSLPTSTQATVYGGSQPTSSGTEIGTTDGRTGEVTLKPSEPVDARYVTVWFTSLAPSDDGRYRATLGEITIK